jgi:hypothetical protein
LNRSPDSLWILHHFIRAKANNLPSVTLHHCCTPRIRFYLVSVMIAVDLDDQSFRGAREVSEVRANRMLAAELNAFHAMSPDQFPVDALGAAGIASQFSCSLGLSNHAPSPRLSP